MMRHAHHASANGHTRAYAHIVCCQDRIARINPDTGVVVSTGPSVMQRKPTPRHPIPLLMLCHRLDLIAGLDTTARTD